MHLDNLLEHLNPHGPYQILSWLVLSLFTCFPPAWHQFAITFTAFFPTKYGCTAANWTTTSGANKTFTVRVPIGNESCLASVSHYSDNSSSAVLLSSSYESCPASDFWYNPEDPVKTSFVTQWNLVCSREQLLVIINAAEGAGEVIGCVIFGYLADRFGRKVGFFSSAGALFFSGLLCAFAPHPAVAILARLAIGIALTGMNNIGFLMNAELFTPKMRTIFSTGGELMWALAVVSMAGIGYLIRDSFWFMIAITLPIVLIIPFWWFINESLHWHLSKGHIDRAKESLRHVAKFNRVKIDEDLMNRVIEEDIAHELEVIHSHRSVAHSQSVAIISRHNSMRSLRSQKQETPSTNDIKFNPSKQPLLQLEQSSPAQQQNGNSKQRLLIVPNPTTVTDASSTVTPAVVSDQPITHPVKTSLPSSFSSQPVVTSPISRRSSSVSTLEKVDGGVLNLFRTPRLRIITIFLTMLWFSNTMCYYGLQLAAQFIEGVDFYLTFFILAVVEVPSIFVVIPLMVRFGRRWTMITFQILAGISCIIVPFIPAGNEVATISVAAFGKFAVCSSFTVLYVYAVELFPTVLRGTGFGVVSVIGRVGMIVAPLVNSLGYGESSSSVPQWVPMVIYGTVMMGTGFLNLPLPETTNQPLADTVEEIENYAQYCRDYHKTNAVESGGGDVDGEALDKEKSTCQCVSSH